MTIHKWVSTVRLGLLVLAVGGLVAGCGSGSDGSNGAPGATGATGPQGPAGPAGTGVSLNAANFTADQAKNTVLMGLITAPPVINSPPVVNFKVTDASGNPITGLTGSQLRFTIAKLVPGVTTTISTNGTVTGTTTSASKWVNYIVTAGVPAVDTSTGNSYSGKVVTQPSRPSTEAPCTTTTTNCGNLVDHGDGTYTYTFARNINGTSASVCDATSATTAATCPVQAALNNWFGTLTTRNAASGSDVYVKSEILGADGKLLDYDPTLTHRIAIQVSGTVNGNALDNPINIIYDWVPATGAQPTAANERNLVDVQACNSCHGKAGVPLKGLGTTTPHGGRVDPQYCVMCHTDQRKNGRLDSTPGAGGFTGNVYRVGGASWGNFPTMIHKIHMGEDLDSQPIPGYAGSNFAGVQFNDITYPQDQRNCTKCHSGTAATNASNWMNVPSLESCGACHDHVPSTTNATVTSAQHTGGAGLDNTKCAQCHSPAAIASFHIPATPPDPTSAWVAGGSSANSHTNTGYLASNQSNLPAGAIKVTFSVTSVGTVVDGVNNVLHPTITFCLQQAGACTNFSSPDITKSIWANTIWPNFIGAPSLQFAWAEQQDGNTTPADWNVQKSVSLKKLWYNNNGTYNADGTNKAAGIDTLSAPSSSGLYTATLKSISISMKGKMLAGGVGWSYGGTFPLTQTNVAGYPVTPAVYAAGYNPASDTDNMVGGLVVVTPVTMVAATGKDGSNANWVARRTIVDNNACNNCHQVLGPFTSGQFHAGQRNNGQYCGQCHDSNRTNNGWSLDSTTFIHNIHNPSMRTNPFTYLGRPGTGSDPADLSTGSDVTYPNELFQCNACHVSNAVNFGMTANASAAPNRLFKTSAAGTVTVPADKSNGSPAGSYGTGYSVSSSATAVTINPAAGTTLVSSPTAAACSSCHDDATSGYHMKANGGLIGVARSTVPTDSSGKLLNNEQCLLCHGSGAIADAETMHASQW